MSMTPEEIDKVRFIINSMAWTGFFEPVLKAIRADWINQLIDPSIKRKDTRSDDFIRGCIYTINGLLVFPRLVVAEADEDEVRKVIDEEDDKRYAERAAAGPFSPLPT